MENGSMTKQLTWFRSIIVSFSEDGPLVPLIELGFIAPANCASRSLDDLGVAGLLYLEGTS